MKFPPLLTGLVIQALLESGLVEPEMTIDGRLVDYDSPRRIGGKLDILADKDAIPFVVQACVYADIALERLTGERTTVGLSMLVELFEDFSLPGALRDYWTRRRYCTVDQLNLEFLADGLLRSHELARTGRIDFDAFPSV